MQSINNSPLVRAITTSLLIGFRFKKDRRRFDQILSELLQPQGNDKADELFYEIWALMKLYSFAPDNITLKRLTNLCRLNYDAELDSRLGKGADEDDSNYEIFVICLELATRRSLAQALNVQVIRAADADWRLERAFEAMKAHHDLMDADHVISAAIDAREHREAKSEISVIRERLQKFESDRQAVQLRQ